MNSEIIINENPLIDFAENTPINQSITLSLSNKNVPHDYLNLEFNNYHFNEGLIFQLNGSDKKIKQVKLIFKNCIIQNAGILDRNFINTNENQEIQINFYECIISDLSFESCQFSMLGFGTCILPNRGVTLKKSIIQTTILSNVLGNFYAFDNNETNYQIQYHDNSIIPSDTLFYQELNKLSPKRSRKNIFQLETVFRISNFKNLYYDTNFSKSQSGFIEEKNSFINKSTNKLESRIENKYYLTKKNKSELNIALILTFNSESSKNVTLKNSTFRALELRNKTEASILIEDCSCNSCYIHDFQSPDFKVFGLKPFEDKSKIEFRNSNLNHAWFDRVDLRNFSIVSFYRTKLEELKFTSTNFPANIEVFKNIHDPKDTSDNYSELKFDNYRQLKNALLSNGDHVRALDMQSKMYDSLLDSNTLQKRDKFILRLNKVTNQHGTNYLKTLKFIIGTILIISVIFFLTLKELPIEFGYENFDRFKEGTVITLNYLAKLISTIANPTHKISTLENITGHPLSTFNYVLSFVSRILIAWLYYQFIMAFRKFTRKL